MNEVKLQKYIEEISMGPFGSDIKVDNFIEEGVPVLNGSNLTSNKLVEDGFKYVSDKKAKTLGKAIALRGDIVITHRGTLGQVSFIPNNSKFERYVISQSQFRVRFKKDIDPEYFSYLMKTSYGQAKLLSFKNHVGVPALAQATTNFKALELRIHSFNTQQKIASVLSALDDKIELNNRINQELEAMAKLIYEYWFVQFDFPVVTSSGVQKPYKSSGGKMVWNKELKREIPEGWEDGSLLDIATFTNGIACQKYRPEDDEDFYRVIKIREMGEGFTDKSEIVSRKIPEKVVIRNGDVLFSWSATLDVKIWTGGIGGLNQHIFKVTSSKFPRSFYYFEVLRYLQYFKMVAELRKTTMGHITRDHLAQSRIAIPPIDLAEKLDEMINSILEKIVISHAENQELASLREWLLPILMNGQVTVEDAEEMVEEKLGMVAEPLAPYGKSVALNIPDNRKGFAKQVLAGKIVSEFRNDSNFTSIKFHKIQFLAEHLIEAYLNLNYYYQAAGPYDNRFMHTIYNDFRKQKWFDCQNTRFIPLEKQEKIEGYYQGYFAPAQNQLASLFDLLYPKSEAEAEIIATAYAVWNNRVIEGRTTEESELVEDFYLWSDRKKQYSKEQILSGLKCLKDNKMEPRGFGKLIKKAKGYGQN